jgi:large subunit ribosomal protein L29
VKKLNVVDLTSAELDQQLEEAHHELFNLRFQLAVGRLRNYSRISQVRRDIARIKTEQNRRRIEGEAQQEAEA